MATPRYRLGNQILLVHGKYASALYDFSGNRIQRISSGLGEVLSDKHTGWRANQHGAKLNQILDSLAARGFLDEDKGNFPGNYSFDSRHPRFPQIRTISFEIDRITTQDDIDQIKQLVIDAHDNYGLGSFAFLISGNTQTNIGIESAILDILGRTKYALCELWGNQSTVISNLYLKLSTTTHSDRILLSKICSDADAFAGISKEGVRFAWSFKFKLSPTSLICRADYFHLLKNWGESYGCLHFDKEGRIYPDVSEVEFSINSADSGLANLLQSKQLKEYWSTSKDKRDKCRDCEFRYACPNPLSKRSVGPVLASAPGNCGYDLEQGKWQ